MIEEVPTSVQTVQHPPADAAGILGRAGHSVQAYLTALRPRYDRAPARLLDAIEYSLMAGGKRLRPALVLETARACGASADNRSALAAAGAIELIHTFSLVH